MPRVFVSIGSNIDRDLHVRCALDALDDHFGELLVSPVYESEAVGFVGDTFYNLVVGFDTDLEVAELGALLRRIEDANQRRRDGSRFGARTLDIDILLHGNAFGVLDGVVLPRPEILEQAHVLRPLADIAAEERYPSNGKTYAELWDRHDKSRQKLVPVNFSWRRQSISSAPPD